MKDQCMVCRAPLDPYAESTLISDYFHFAHKKCVQLIDSGELQCKNCSQKIHPDNVKVEQDFVVALCPSCHKEKIK